MRLAEPESAATAAGAEMDERTAWVRIMCSLRCPVAMTVVVAAFGDVAAKGGSNLLGPLRTARLRRARDGRGRGRREGRHRLLRWRQQAPSHLNQGNGGPDQRDPGEAQQGEAEPAAGAWKSPHTAHQGQGPQQGLHTGDQHQGHGSTATGLADQLTPSLRRQAGLVFPHQLAILLGEPVTKAAGFLEFPLEPALAPAGRLFAGNGSTSPSDPSEQPGYPTDDIDWGHGAPQPGHQEPQPIPADPPPTGARRTDPPLEAAAAQAVR